MGTMAMSHYYRRWCFYSPNWRYLSCCTQLSGYLRNGLHQAGEVYYEDIRIELNQRFECRILLHFKLAVSAPEDRKEPEEMKREIEEMLDA